MREWTTKHIEDLVKKTIKDINIGSGDEYLRTVFRDIRYNDANVIEYTRKKGNRYGDFYFYIQDVMTYRTINTLADITITDTLGNKNDYYILAAFPYAYYIENESPTASDFFYWNEVFQPGNDAILTTGILGEEVTIPKADLLCTTLYSTANITFSAEYNRGSVALNNIGDDINVLLLKKSSTVVNKTLVGLSLKLN